MTPHAKPAAPVPDDLHHAPTPLWWRLILLAAAGAVGVSAYFGREALGKIVQYENTVFDPPPLEMYTFLFNIGYGGGDGMEHLYSTQCISGMPWREDAPVLGGLTTAAHEYFHVWNMKRVRAAALGPFDYTREQYQPSLWVGEGWTQY